MCVYSLTVAVIIHKESSNNGLFKGANSFKEMLRIKKNIVQNICACSHLPFTLSVASHRWGLQC